MSRALLDTSAYSAFKRGHPEVVASQRRPSAVLLPMIVLGELLAGFAAGQRSRRNRDELDAFRSSPRVAVVPLGETTAECYAAIHVALRRAGTPVATNDLWIAASAMEHGAELLTLDRAFLMIGQVRVTCFDP
jgi:predicted nucleic acid-binding protein